MIVTRDDLKIAAIVGVLMLLSGVFAFTALRVVPAYVQCFGPAFAHSRACFVHDVVTGEDL